jgi:hypothetical protein
MADHHVAMAGGHPDMDYAEHEKSYKLFLGFVKYGTIGVILLVLILAFVTL